MVVFLAVLTETDSKPVSENDYKKGAKPVYRKKVQDVSRSLDHDLKREARERCCCGKCYPWCICCCPEEKKLTSDEKQL